MPPISTLMPSPIPKTKQRCRYTLRKKAFFRNLGTITAFAVLGTLVSTFLVGFLTYGCGKVCPFVCICIYYVSYAPRPVDHRLNQTALHATPCHPHTKQIGLIPIDTRNPLEALIFGALISAVDPVATLSIIGCVRLLFVFICCRMNWIGGRDGGGCLLS